MRNILCVCLFSLAASLATVANSSSRYEIDTSARVVAFGDVHGAYQRWTALLAEVGVIDDEYNWSGGDTHLVSLGDLIDRGAGSRKVVELLIKLDKQAAEAGGAVHMVLGNHEVMVMTGDLRYVSPAEYAVFAADESAAERNEMYVQYRKFNRGGEDTDVREKFDMQYPPGYIALKRAYARGGELGQWLSTKPFIIRVNDKVYMHGGIASRISEQSITQLNTQLRDELTSYLQSIETLNAAAVMPLYVDIDNRLAFLNARAEDFAADNPRVRAPWFDALQKIFDAQEHLLFSTDSPHWYRGTALCHPYAESFNTERFLKRAGAQQLVMGHAPTSGEVEARMDDLVIRLDTGMWRKVHKGRVSVLISQDGEDHVHYLGGKDKVQPVRRRNSLAQKLSGMSDAQLEIFMRTAKIENVEYIGTGITKPKRVSQTLDGVSNDAVFKYEDTDPGLESRKGYHSRRYKNSDRYIYDVAAYKLDRMLGWEMIPTAVLAEVDGDRGALSDWVENSINERDRLERDITFGGFCKQQEQYRLRFVFDILIHNDDRNLTNIIWTKDDFMMKFIDHSLAFRVAPKRPKQYKKVELQVSDLLAERLQSLTLESLGRELSPYLHAKQIRAILERRDLILNEATRTSP